MKRTAAIFLLLLFSGCAALENVVRDFNLVSVSEEKEISDKMAKEISQKMNIVKDAQMNGRVNSIGERLLKVLPNKEFDYQFFVIEDKTPNAFTIPGGKIYVHTGLLTFVDNDSELAGVLAHEIGHAAERHPVKNLSRAYGAGYLVSLLTGGDPNNQLKVMAINLATGSALLKYSRSDELEADEIGFELVCRSGSGTQGLPNFLKKLQSLQTSGRQITFLSTHPATADRIRRLEGMKC